MAGCHSLLCMLTNTLLSEAYQCCAAMIGQMSAVRKAD